MSERSAEEMDRVLAAVKVLWEVCPQVRLGQLVCIVAGGDPFYMEDDRLVEKASALADVRRLGGLQLPMTLKVSFPVDKEGRPIVDSEYGPEVAEWAYDAWRHERKTWKGRWKFVSLTWVKEDGKNHLGSQMYVLDYSWLGLLTKPFRRFWHSLWALETLNER